MITGTKKGRLFWWPRPVAAAPTSHGANGHGTCAYYSYISGALPLTTWIIASELITDLFSSVVMGITYLTIDLIQPNLAGDLSLH